MFNSVYHTHAIVRVVGVAAIALLAAGCQHDKLPMEVDPEIRPVRVEKAITRRLGDEHQYAGAVRPRYETQLAFRVGGKIVTRQVEVGSIVKPGDILMRLDPEDLEFDVQSLKAQVAAARADLDQAKSELDRYKDLFSRKLVSQSEYDRRVSAFEAAQARYEQAAALLAESAQRTSYTILRADQSGVITAVQAEVGQVVVAGQPVLDLALPEEKEVVISIPENRLNELYPEQEVLITLWAVPEAEYLGKVREIAPVADPVTRTYTAKVSVLNPDKAMHLGMTAKVIVRRELTKAAIRLPRTALVEKEGQPAVWVVDSDTLTVHLVPVTLGEFRGEDFTVQKGLEDGLLVVTAGAQKLYPGQEVRLLEETL